MSLRFQYVVKEIGPHDMADFTSVYAAIATGGQSRPEAWAERFAEQLGWGGRVWVITQDKTKPAGYAILNPLPGLAGVYDLNGGIIPNGRGKGLGTVLLDGVRAAAAQSGAHRLSARVDDLEDETARFLLRRGFFVEHEECLLQLDSFDNLPPPPPSPPGDLVNYPRQRAIREFCRVYDESFHNTPWSQPYSEDEVEDALGEAEDMMFMEVGGRAIGVAWQQIISNGRGQLEPLGIVPAYRGRGYGRRLLLATLHSLHRRVFAVEIGTWRSNTIALNLYKSLGFSEVQNWYYLACDLQGLKAE